MASPTKQQHSRVPKGTFGLKQWRPCVCK